MIQKISWKSQNRIVKNFQKKSKFLKQKIESLINGLTKFTKEKQYLDLLVGSQRFSNKISSISYDGFVNHEKYNNYFFKALSSLFSSITCFYCNKKGYMIH